MPDVVKGSKQQPMVVVPYRPDRRRLYAMLVAVCLAVSLLGGWYVGYHRAFRSVALAEAGHAELAVRLESVQAENAELKRRIAMLDRASLLDQHSNEELQSTIRSMQGRVRQLEQDIRYYRRVLSGDTVDTGLVLGDLAVEETGQPGRYHFRLVLRQQDADGDSFLTGHVKVRLVGRQNNEKVVYSLHEISESEDQLDISLRFKYFQIIEGDLALPVGFEPDRFQVAAVSTEPVGKTVSRDYRWIAQSR